MDVIYESKQIQLRRNMMRYTFTKEKILTKVGLPWSWKKTREARSQSVRETHAHR